MENEAQAAEGGAETPPDRTDRTDLSPHILCCNYPSGPIGAPGCVCTVTSKYELARLVATAAEVDRLQALFEAQCAQLRTANWMWREAHPDEYALPDLGTLLRWLTDEIRQTRERLLIVRHTAAEFRAQRDEWCQRHCWQANEAARLLEENGRLSHQLQIERNFRGE